MADYAVMPKSDYQDACNAVREKTGETGVIKSGDMGAKIRGISGATITHGQINFDTSDADGATLAIDTYVLLRVPLPIDVTNVKFLMVSISGYSYSSKTSTSSTYEIGTFSSSGALDNQDGSNTDFLFTGNRAYSYEDEDGAIKNYSWEDDDLPFFNASLNCLEFRIAAKSGQATVLSAYGDLHYWYF